MIRGTKRTRESCDLTTDMTFKASIHNKFEIEVIDSKTGLVKEKACGYNTICDKLWTTLLTPAAYNEYIHYGSGSGTPSASDTSLFKFEGYGTSGEYSWSSDYSTGVAKFTTRLQLSETQAVGVNLTEVGIASGTDSSTLCTHAMLQDMNGNQVSLLKTDTDIVNIYATIFVHWNPNGYDNGYIQIIGAMRSYYRFTGGSSTNSNQAQGFLRYLAGKYRATAGTWACEIYPLKYMVAAKAPTTSYNSGNVSVTMSIEPSEKKLVITASRLAAGSCNVGGIGCLMIGYKTSASKNGSLLMLTPGGSWCGESDIVGESIGTGDGSKTRFSTAFDYPENASVYIDGVLCTEGVTVHKWARQSDLAPYMYEIEKDSTVDSIKPIMGYGPAAQGSTRDPGSITYHYNPHFEIGISSVYVGSTSAVAYGSNDMSTWTQLTSKSGSTSMSGDNRYFKFFKFEVDPTYPYTMTAYVLPCDYDGCNVIFDTPPAEGSVITMDYHTPFIAKDENHVFDCSVTIQLGEYTGD